MRAGNMLAISWGTLLDNKTNLPVLKKKGKGKKWSSKHCVKMDQPKKQKMKSQLTFFHEEA